MISLRRVMRVTVAVVLVAAGVSFLAYWHCINCCVAPKASRPIFGDYTVHCMWNGGVEELRVFNLQANTRPSLDPISLVAVRRLAQMAAAEALSPAGKRFVRAEVDLRVYGDFFPCQTEIITVESTPRVGVHPPRVIDLPGKVPHTCCSSLRLSR